MYEAKEREMLRLFFIFTVKITKIFIGDDVVEEWEHISMSLARCEWTWEICLTDIFMAKNKVVKGRKHASLSRSVVIQFSIWRL